jgi:predicted house-cleaning NTP pyrophosphatase (Maf/HAM1 superfamily)
VDEAFREGEPSEEYVARLARRKAAKAGEKHKSRWVLAADTIVVVDGGSSANRAAVRKPRRCSGC